jgi:hypothetical protein
LAVMAAAAAVHERFRPIAERQGDLPAEREVGRRPVREEVADVLAEGVGEGGHAPHRSGWSGLIGSGAGGCETCRVSDGSAARVWGFALTAAGALVAGIGTTVVWTSVGLRQDLRGVLDSDFAGLDLPEGIAVLVLSVTTLIGVVVVRRLQGRGRVWGAVALLVMGVAIVALPVWTVLRAEDRAVDDVARVIADAGGLTIDEAISLVRAEPEFEVDVVTSGAWTSIIGGLVVVAGACMTLLWANRSTNAETVT